MPDRVHNVLFLSAGNSARSILAESILRKEGAGTFKAFFAASHPKGVVDPVALKALKAMDYPSEGLRSKGWDEFAHPGAPDLDFVFTLSDTAAGEVRPIWPARPMTADWSIENPAAVKGADLEKKAAAPSSASRSRALTASRSAHACDGRRSFTPAEAS
jgi:arsenate reductase